MFFRKERVLLYTININDYLDTESNYNKVLYGLAGNARFFDDHVPTKRDPNLTGIFTRVVDMKKPSYRWINVEVQIINTVFTFELAFWKLLSFPRTCRDNW